MKIFDLFSGCGGFRLAAEQNVFESVGYSEINKYAIEFYTNVFEGETNYGDATKIDTSTLPDFDLLCAGFPCQSFSIAGKRQGFNDTRGTMFFEILRILKDKRPRYFILENVKGLLSHDNGETFKTILKSLADLGIYAVEWSVLNSRYFGVPQNRERVFIVGYPRSCGIGKIFPLERKNRENISTNPKTEIVYWKNSKEKWVEETKEYTGTLRTQSDLCRQTLIKPGTIRSFKDGAGFRAMSEPISPALTTRAREDGEMQACILQLGHGFNKGGEFDISPTLTANKYEFNNYVCARAVLTPDRVVVRQNGRRIKEENEASFTLTTADVHGVYDGARLRRLTPLECFRLQGWPDELFMKGASGISDAQLYKLAGNSVTVTVVSEIMKAIKKIERTKNEKERNR